MNRIIYTFLKTLAVLFVLFIFLSISALAQSFTLHNIALLVVSVICLNKCCEVRKNHEYQYSLARRLYCGHL